MSTQLLIQDTRKDTGPPLAPCVLGYKWFILHKLSLCSMFITVKGWACEVGLVNRKFVLVGGAVRTNPT